MPQAIVDPDELREFASNLRSFNQLVADATARMQQQFSQLGETWRDQEHVKFAEEFQETIRAIQQFHDVSEAHIPHLLRKAGDIDKYLGQ